MHLTRLFFGDTPTGNLWRTAEGPAGVSPESLGDTLGAWAAAG